MVRPTLHRRALLNALLATAVAGAAGGRAFAQADAAFDEAARRAEALDQLNAMVIVHDGETRFSRAFRGPDPDRPVNVKSLSKTIVALLTGIAIGRGALDGTEARLGELIPDLIPAGADPRVAAITVADLLTMQAGLERTSGPNYGRWVESRNWLAFALSQPFVAEPGEAFQYSTGTFHILGAVLTTATGESLHALARDWLGRPLGIDIPPWTRDPQGYFLGGNNMALSPNAVARIGEMVRMGGTWAGTEVVPADWIATSWRPRALSPWSGDEYGYGWFLTELAGERTFYGRGFGGQMLYILPDLRLTVVVTSDPLRPARTEGHVGDLHGLVAEAIIPQLSA